MDEYPKQVTLSSGEIVELRPLGSEDGPALTEFFLALPPESTEFLKHDVRDPNVVKRFVETIDSTSVFAIVAVTRDGRIVADATLHMVLRGWRRHVGEIRGVVAAEMRRQRLATALVHELVDQASLKGLKKLEAQILDSQSDARKVFERMGFKEEARLKQHAMDRHDHLHDVVILTNSVDDLWRQMEEMISDMEMARGKF